MTDEQNPPRRRRGNPAMRRGAPSLNPHGRPPVGRTLAAAIRQRVPPDTIVTLALHIVDDTASTPETRLRTLELLARRGYGAIAALGRSAA
jgi:hypothetical protein